MSKKKKKYTKVDKKFLTDLANEIYNPKNKKFLRLCNGRLQNGPDPENPERPMHCGLGELYFKITGNQPYDDHVSENDVINLAVKQSTLADHYLDDDGAFEMAQFEIEKASKLIKKLNIPQALKTEAINGLHYVDYEDVVARTKQNEQAEKFKDLLSNVPKTNDDGHGCSIDDQVYLERSKRVAAQLKKAAKLLPQ